MMKTLSFIGLILICILLISGCKFSISTTPDSVVPVTVSKSGSGAKSVTKGVDERNYKITTLASGKKIKLIGITILTFAPGGDPPALLLKYQTDLPISNTKALDKETQKIWKDFRPDVEKAKLTTGIITAAEAAKGGAVWHRKTYTFAWKKSPDGTWHELNKK